jgi:EpsI family protein
VALYVGYYRHQRQGAELVSSRNVVAGAAQSGWMSSGEIPRTENLAREIGLRQTWLRSAGGHLLVWDWYRIGERDLSNPYVAKALLARDRLLGRGDDAAAIVLATPYDARPEIAAETLRLFAREMLPSIDAALKVAMPGKPG